jgi:GNAT superfamily N-acetyltransferase
MNEAQNLPYERSGLSSVRQGLLVIIRRVRLDDGPALLELLCGLSARAIRLRYLVARSFSPGTACAEAERMLRGRGGRTITLVATIVEAGVNQIVAVGELVPSASDPSVAAIALVVCDDYQRRGLGRNLLDQLVRQARASGVSHLRADLLAENGAVCQLLDGLGLPINATSSYGEISAIIALNAEQRHTHPLPVAPCYQK